MAAVKQSDAINAPLMMTKAVIVVRMNLSIRVKTKLWIANQLMPILQVGSSLNLIEKIYAIQTNQFTTETHQLTVFLVMSQAISAIK